MFEHRCKLCKLGKADKSSLIKIHNLRFKEDVPLRMMEEKVKEIITTHESEEVRAMEPPSYVAISLHFAKHTTPRLQAKYKTQAALPALMKAARRELGTAPEIEVELKKIENEKFKPYEDLSKLYNLMQNRFNDFDTSQGGRIDLGLPGEKGNLEGYVQLSKWLRDTVAELNKIRQSEQLAKNMVHFALMQYSKAIIESTMAELEMLRKQLASHVRDGLIVDDIIDTLQNNFAVALTKSADGTLKKTELQFNLN